MICSILFPAGLGLLLLALAIIILLRNERLYQRRRLIEERHRTLGLPAGELVYEDADGQGALLFSDQYPLAGKPDYVVKLDDSRWSQSNSSFRLRTPRRHIVIMSCR